LLCGIFLRTYYGGEFLDAGYTQQQILEVILGLAHKVISNYTNHVAKTPVDAVFKKFAWKKPAAEAA
jgi:hypothetical protein